MLQFAELDQVFPSWTNPSTTFNRVKELENIKLFKPHLDFYDKNFLKSKFRVINGKIEIDNRNFQFICRKISGDSRWEILKIIDNLVKTYNMHEDIIKFVKVIHEGCYKNDEKWKESLYKIIPLMYLHENILGEIMSPMTPRYPSPSTPFHFNERTTISDHEIVIYLANKDKDKDKDKDKEKKECPPTLYDYFIGDKKY